MQRLPGRSTCLKTLWTKSSLSLKDVSFQLTSSMLSPEKRPTMYTVGFPVEQQGEERGSGTSEKELSNGPLVT